MFKGFSEKIHSWELLADSLQLHLPEMPFLQPLYDELRTAIQQAHDVLNTQESARSQLRDLVEQRRQLEVDGESLRSRAASHLRGRFGFKSQELVEFGLTPLASRPRQKKDQPLPPGPE